MRGRWEYAGADYHEVVVRPPGQEVELRLTSDLNLGIEGPRTTVRHMMKEGDSVFCALSWSEHRAARVR